MTVSPSEIRKMVTEQDDFGHELRVGAIIREAAPEAFEHGGTYTDPVSGKPRQFDYRFSIAAENARISVAVECKNLVSPLVACGIGRRQTEAYHDLIESKRVFLAPGSTGLSWTSATRRLVSQRPNDLYPHREFVAKTLLRPKHEKRDRTTKLIIPESGRDSDIYDKWAQAVSSAEALARNACAAAGALPRGKFLSAILPVVVVPDNQLWTVEYDNDGNIMSDPKPETGCSLFVGKEISVGREGHLHGFAFSHVNIYTHKGFTSFLQAIQPLHPGWLSIFTDTAAQR